MNTVEELRVFLDSQGFNPLLLLDGPEAQEIVEEIFNANMFFSNVADGNTYEFSDEELRNYLSEAFDGGEAVIVPELIKALRIAQIFWNSDYTPEEQEDMTKFFNNMYESFEGGQLYPTLEENITFYEQVRATVSGEESPDVPVETEIGFPFAPDGPSLDGPISIPPVGTSMIPGAEQFGDFAWMDYWGDDDPRVEAFFQEWVERYDAEVINAKIPNENAFIQKFLWDAEDGLYNQSWYRDIQDSVKHHLEFWYESGGRGHHWGGLSGGIAGLPEGNPYNTAMQQYRDIAEDTISTTMGLKWLLVDGTITPEMLNKYAYAIMTQGGATYRLGKNIEMLSPETFEDKARQIVEKMVFADTLNEDGTFKQPEKMHDFGPGSVTTLINKWKTLAKQQFMDIPDSKLRQWAMEVKSEKGLTEDMVNQRINELAFYRVDFPFTPEERDNYIAEGVTMESLLGPQYMAAVGPNAWNDMSIQPDDPWLLDNYVFVDDNGNRRFRTAAEMRDHSRTNMERFQHSPVAQNFFNDFITKTASLFRSDY